MHKRGGQKGHLTSDAFPYRRILCAGVSQAIFMPLPPMLPTAYAGRACSLAESPGGMMISSSDAVFAQNRNETKAFSGFYRIPSNSDKKNKLHAYCSFFCSGSDWGPKAQGISASPARPPAPPRPPPRPPVPGSCPSIQGGGGAGASE